MLGKPTCTFLKCQTLLPKANVLDHIATKQLEHYVTSCAEAYVVLGYCANTSLQYWHFNFMLCTFEHGYRSKLEERVR